ncbi:SCO6745 family protein [Streptomyces sp. KL2]|uniref:SCO6745 family protein n=1 Tax=Streptomyces sp. KL2 TaxID=3050126 RepID=UPI003978C123
MTAPPLDAVRRCHGVLNALHSTVYFTPYLDKELAAYGIDDPMAAYLAGRAAPLGPVGAGPVTATFYSFHHGLVARHVPRVWDLAAPETVWAARLRAADATLRRALGDRLVEGPEVAEAAELALRAAEGCRRPGRPLYAAHADRPVPDEPHLVLWYAATLLREHRGDGHVAALDGAGLDGLEALVSHSASGEGMPKEIVMTKRGWTEEDWAAAEERLRGRGLMAADGTLTPQGRRLRRDLEETTDRMDLAPYERLGARATGRLTELADGLVGEAARSGVFPPVLLGFFTGRNHTGDHSGGGTGNGTEGTPR